MPWVYTLTLAEFTDAATIQTDWEETIPGNATVKNSYGGVTVGGTRCVIVSERNDPDFQDMEAFDYVAVIAEHKEIPSRGSGDFDPPIALGNGFELVE